MWPPVVPVGTVGLRWGMLLVFAFAVVGAATAEGGLQIIPL